MKKRLPPPSFQAGAFPYLADRKVFPAMHTDRSVDVIINLLSFGRILAVGGVTGARFFNADMGLSSES